MKIKKMMAIVNPNSGRKRGMKCYEELIAWRDGAAKETGIEVEVVLTDKSEERNTTALAERAVREGYDLILVVGGDGTVNEVANGIRGSDIPLLIACAGNGNDFGRALGSPGEINEVVDLISHGQIRSVDLMEVNGRIGVNILGIGGIDTRVVEYVEGTLKKKCGFIPPNLLYLVGLLREILRVRIKYPCLKLEVQEQGLPARIMEGEVTLLAVGNGPTCGGIFRLTPDADLTDGKVDICWIRKTGRIRILENIIKATKGTHLEMPEVETLPDRTLPRLTSFIVSSFEFLPAELDGETIPPAKEFKITVIPQGMKVLVPPSILVAQRPLLVKTVKASELQLA